MKHFLAWLFLVLTVVGGLAGVIWVLAMAIKGAAWPWWVCFLVVLGACAWAWAVDYALGVMVDEEGEEANGR